MRAAPHRQRARTGPLFAANNKVQGQGGARGTPAAANAAPIPRGIGAGRAQLSPPHRSRPPTQGTPAAVNPAPIPRGRRAVLGPSSEVPVHGLLPPQRRSGTPRRDRSRRRWRPVPCSAHRLPCSIPAARAMALPPPSKVKSTPAEHPPPGPSSSSSSSSSASCLGAREGGRRRGGPTWTVQPFSRRTRKADLPLPRTACTRPRTSTAAPARAAVSAPTSVHTFPVTACDCTRGAGPYLPAASSGSLGSSTTCAALPPVSPRPPARGRPRPRGRAPAGAEREAERAGRTCGSGREREGGRDGPPA